MKLAEEFKTNIRIIDEQHSHLFEIVEKLKKIEGNIDDIELLIIEIFEYTKYHFSTEEEFWKKYSHELYEIQKKEHEAFKKLVESYIDEINKTDDLEKFKDDITLFLERWLKNHVLKEDTKLREYVKK